MDCANNWRCVVTTGNKTTKNRQLVSVKHLLSLHDKNVVYLDTCASCVFFYSFPSCSQHACTIPNSPKKIQSCLHCSVLALNHRSWLAVATCPNGLGYCPTNLALLFFQLPEAAAN